MNQKKKNYCSKVAQKFSWLVSRVLWHITPCWLFNLRSYIYIYIYIYMHSWPTVVKGDPNTPFPIATIPKRSGGRYSFPWITPLTLDLYLIMQRINKRHQVPFLNLLNDSTLDWTPVSWASGEHSIMIMSRNIYIYIYIFIPLYLLKYCNVILILILIQFEFSHLFARS